jgi:glyoxylase-like metal-dependent hydrolase (beta-lactamase superfamily II)
MLHDEPWTEVADGVLVRRHRRLDLNVGLVVGAERCLVVDTHESPRQGEDLVRAIRRVTPLPWVVVNTHAHYDHVFGNRAFRPCDIWGHARCAEVVDVYGEVQRDAVVRAAQEHGFDELARAVAEVEIVAPTRTFADHVTIDLGGIGVELVHLGRGHTDSDVVVQVPVGVTFAGDLVEEGASPAFEDAFPLDWPGTLERLLDRCEGAVVPGHGGVVDREFVQGQAQELATVAAVARDVVGGRRDPGTAVAAVPFPAAVAEQALERAFRQLRGAPPYDPPERLRAELGLT